MNKFLVSFFAMAGCASSLRAQVTAFGEYNTITTAVPFLIISPDSRAGGMGDVGVSTSSDANNLHWNVAKLAFLDKKQNSLALSYTPWLSRLVPDIDLAYLSYQVQTGRRGGLGFSLRYFSLGEINLTDDFGNPQGTLNPNEFAFDGGYALQLSERLSLGVALRYIYSNLGQSNVSGAGNTKAGQSFAADVGTFYTSREFNLGSGQKGSYQLGMLLSNMGAKITYSDDANADFIPTNLRLGGTFLWAFDEYNKLGLSLEANKLLVPTPPIREGDRGIDSDENGNGIPNEILAGEDDNVNFFTGMMQSFNDAPGGASEEFKEIVWNFGAEYIYDDVFRFRGGYQYESEMKGNRKYFTMGVGLKYNVFALDFAYLIPGTPTVTSPLENTLRFTLIYDFRTGTDEG
jgi:long-subunit fatty acid transport protein